MNVIIISVVKQLVFMVNMKKRKMCHVCYILLLSCIMYRTATKMKIVLEYTKIYIRYIKSFIIFYAKVLQVVG